MADQHQGVDAIASIPESVADALRATMVLGLPNDDSMKPTFYFDREVDWANHDSSGEPWDWTAAPESSTQKAAVSPICAYEFFSPLGRQGEHSTEAGDFNPTTVVFTLLEDDFNEVQGFSYATVGPSDQKWWFRYYRPAYGLGEMTVYQIHCSAEGLP